VHDPYCVSRAYRRIIRCWLDATGLTRHLYINIFSSTAFLGEVTHGSSWQLLSSWSKVQNGPNGPK
jgi:hypothetical protein